jgi:sugar phosphate isomerase/epimerase
MRDSTRDFISYVPLNEAAFNVEAIVRALARDGYDGWLTLEPHVTGAAILEFYKREVPYLKKLLAACA